MGYQPPSTGTLKGIDILRNMHRRYNDVTPNDLSLYEIKLGEFKFEDVTTNPSWKIKQWKPLYDILLKHGKINEQHALSKLVNSLHPSYKAQMLDSSLYHRHAQRIGQHYDYLFIFRRDVEGLRLF